MDVIDEFDINIIKELEKIHGLLGNCCDIKISNTMVHQRINRLMEQGIIRVKAYHKRKENRL
jgi:Lrp/AsnC family transcriptional regulator for asnA, asnC and gidA